MPWDYRARYLQATMSVHYTRIGGWEPNSCYDILWSEHHRSGCTKLPNAIAEWQLHHQGVHRLHDSISEDHQRLESAFEATCFSYGCKFEGVVDTFSLLIRL